MHEIQHGLHPSKSLLQRHQQHPQDRALWSREKKNNCVEFMISVQLEAFIPLSTNIIYRCTKVSYNPLKLEHPFMMWVASGITRWLSCLCGVGRRRWELLPPCERHPEPEMRYMIWYHIWLQFSYTSLKLHTQEGAKIILYLSWYFFSTMAESGEKSGSPEMASCPGSSRLESEMREGS